MFAKTLAIAALLGCSQAQQGKKTIDDLSEKDIEGLQIAKGFFEGSKTVTERPTNRDKMIECLMYLDHVHSYADDAYPKFMSQDLQEELSAIKKIAHMIHMIRSSQSQCEALPADWDKLNEMSEAWRNPKDVKFTGDQLLLHGMDIRSQLEASVDAWNKKDFEKVGYELGVASLILINNGKLIDQGIDPNPDQGHQGGHGQHNHHGPNDESDPKKAYFTKMGAEFAAGFLFGANIGGFDEKMLYECLQKEEKAQGIFYNADLELKKALQQGDPSAAIKGFDDMIRFIYDLATEKEGAQKVCPELTADKNKLKEGLRIIHELQNPATTMKMSSDGNNDLVFNKQVISNEAEMWTEAYISGDFKTLGFVFADTLDKHSIFRKQNPRFLI